MPIFIDHLKLSFLADKPLLSYVFEQVALKAAHLMITGEPESIAF